MNLLNITETAAFLSGCGSCLVYTHATPDGDTVGSGTALVLALRAAGINAFAVNADGIPAKLDFLPTNGVFIEEPEDISAYTLISVDIASERMLGSTRTRRFDLSIDHHKVNTVDCDRLLLMADKIAAGEIIYHLIKALIPKLIFNIFRNRAFVCHNINQRKCVSVFVRINGFSKRNILCIFLFITKIH